MFGLGGCDGGGELGELGGFALAFGICLVVVVMVGGGDGGEVFLTIW